MPSPSFSGTFIGTSLTEILRQLVGTKRTGILTIRGTEGEGTLAVENGMIVNATTGTDSGMPALFQFVGWKEAHFDFQQQPLAADFPRELAVYDPGVLITGVAAKA